MVPPTRRIQTTGAEKLSWEEQTRVHEILRRGAIKHSHKEFSEKYLLSFTEMEVQKAIFRCNPENRNALYVERLFEGISSVPFGDQDEIKNRARFIDYDWKAQDFNEAHQQMLVELQKQVGSFLPPERTQHYTIPWDQQGVNPAIHADYLRSFSDFVCQKLVECLFEIAKKSRMRVTPVYQEVISHLEMSRFLSRSLSFCQSYFHHLIDLKAKNRPFRWERGYFIQSKGIHQQLINR